jgi:hypothetical protein
MRQRFVIKLVADISRTMFNLYYEGNGSFTAHIWSAQLFDTYEAATERMNLFFQDDRIYQVDKIFMK